MTDLMIGWLVESGHEDEAMALAQVMTEDMPWSIASYGLSVASEGAGEEAIEYLHEIGRADCVVCFGDAYRGLIGVDPDGDGLEWWLTKLKPEDRVPVNVVTLPNPDRPWWRSQDNQLAAYGAVKTVCDGRVKALNGLIPNG